MRARSRTDGSAHWRTKHGNGAKDYYSTILAPAGSVGIGDRCGRTVVTAIGGPPLNRCRMWATPVLAAVLALLLLAYGRKVGILSTPWLTSHKDALAAVSTALSAAGILLGGLLAYYRFFRGRTLSTRAELAIDVDVIPAPGAQLLHSVTVSVKNVGTVTIWEPRPVIEVMSRHADGTVSSFTIAKWFEMPDGDQGSSRLSALDSGETADFFTQQLFEANVWAVTYAATITCSTGDSWTKLRAVENRARHKKSG